MIRPYEGRHPVRGRQVFIAQGAVVIGDVHMADGVSVWSRTRCSAVTSSRFASEKTATSKTEPSSIPTKVIRWKSAARDYRSCRDYSRHEN